MDHSKQGFPRLEEIIRNLNLTCGAPIVISDFNPVFTVLEERLKEQIFRHGDENALILYSRLQEMKKRTTGMPISSAFAAFSVLLISTTLVAERNFRQGISRRSMVSHTRVSTAEIGFRPPLR